MDCTNTTSSWLEFNKALCHEFGPSEFKDIAESLFKLRHTCTLHDYIAEFRHLATRSLEIGPILLKSCFLWGLKKELRYDVKLLKLANVDEAIAIAVQLDSKLTELKLPHSRAFTTSKCSNIIVAPPHHTIPRTGNLAIKKLTQMRYRRREKGVNVGSIMTSG